MANVIYFKDLPIGSNSDDLFIVTTKDNGDGTYTDFKFKLTEISASSGQNITASTANITTLNNVNDTLRNNWFSGKAIQEIITNNSVYLRNFDFFQSDISAGDGIGDEITLNFTQWNDGQILRSKI